MVDDNGTGGASVGPANGLHASGEVASTGIEVSMRRSLVTRALRVEWLGQTVASLCWIASVLTYGISSAGDWLQLCAASAWLLANLASITSPEGD